MAVRPPGRLSPCCIYWGSAGQTCTNTIARDSISGLSGELCDHDYVTARGEGQEHSNGMSGDPKAKESHGQRIIQGAWTVTATSQAVIPAPLCYRNLQRVKNSVYARAQSYKAVIAVNTLAQEELQWWHKFMKGKRSWHQGHK